jgi:rfaE bifunctional protein nucleotidyltransferase chain/domain
MKQIFNLNEVETLIDQLKRAGKSIVATNGCFDILHIGHLRYLQKSKELGDVLIVGLNSDSSVKKLKGSDRPINNERDRAELLAALKMVDYVTIFSELDAVNFLKAIKPDYYTKGGDYNPEELQNWPEYLTAKELDCKIVLVDFIEGKSTSNILKLVNGEKA